MKKLAIILTHPIQYYAPLFQLLASRNIVTVKVFYTWGEKAKGEVFDPGFGKARQWDIPLTEGYEHEFVSNISKNPGSHHFIGIINPDLIKKIQEYAADAILVFGWSFQSHLSVLRYFKGKISVFFRGDSTLLDIAAASPIKKFLRKIFLTWVYKHIDYAFYVGANNRKYYLEYGVDPLKLIYAPHAVDNVRFTKHAEEYEEKAAKWKRELGIPEGKVTALFAGKLETKKNPLFIVEAARAIPSMHFIIVGNGNLEKEIKEGSATLSNVALLPFQNQSIMPVVYRLADIFVLPSSGPNETWGLALNEAMACGRIVVASNKCGGAIDLIKQGENGFIINPDIDSLLRALLFFNNAADLDKYKNESSKIVEDFSYQRIAEAIESAVLEKAL